MRRSLRDRSRSVDRTIRLAEPEATAADPAEFSALAEIGRQRLGNGQLSK